MKAYVIRIHSKQIISMLITGSAVIVLQFKWKEFSCLVPQSIIIGFTTTHFLRKKVIVWNMCKVFFPSVITYLYCLGGTKHCLLSGATNSLIRVCWLEKQTFKSLEWPFRSQQLQCNRLIWTENLTRCKLAEQTKSDYMSETNNIC